MQWNAVIQHYPYEYIGSVRRQNFSDKQRSSPDLRSLGQYFVLPREVDVGAVDFLDRPLTVHKIKTENRRRPDPGLQSLLS